MSANRVLHAVVLAVSLFPFMAPRAAAGTVTEPIRQFGTGFNGDSVAFHPTEPKAVLSTPGGAVIVDLNTGSVLTFDGHTDWVFSVAFSPDGAQVLTGSADNTAKLWDAATGAEIRTFTGHSSYVISVAFSPDGTQVLTGSGHPDLTAKLWNTATGAEIRTFAGHTNNVYSVAFSPDGTQVLTGASGLFSDNAARLWDVATGAEIRTFAGHADGLSSVVFSPDGGQVLTGSWDDTAKLWDTATGAEIRTFAGHANGVTSVAFSPDGTQVLTGADGPDNTAKLWDTATGAEIRTFAGHTDRVTSVAFSPDGGHALTGSLDYAAKLWDTATGAESRTFVGHTSEVASVAYSPGGAQVLTGSLDGTAKLWDVATGAELRTFEGHLDGLSSVAYSPGGAQVLTGSGDGTAKLWDVATGAELRTFEGHTDVVYSVAFSPDAAQVLTGSEDGTAKLWDTATGNEIRTFAGHTDWVGSVAFSPDGAQVLTGSGDRTAKLWDAATGNEIRTFAGHTGWVLAVAYSPGGAQVLTGSLDGTAKLWDVATGAELRTFEGHTDVVYSVAFSPGGAQVLTGSYDGTAKLWDTATGAEFRTFEGHIDAVYSVAFSPGGAQVLTGSGDRTAILWEFGSLTSIEISIPSPSLANTGPVNYTVTYANAGIVMLDATDITLVKSGTANAAVNVSGSGLGHRTVALSNISGDGTLAIEIAPGSALDDINQPALGVGPSAAVTVDNTVPNTPIITTDGGHGPGVGFTTTDHVVVLQGTAAPDTFEIRVNGTTAGVTYVPGETSWEIRIVLPLGQNEVEIVARDQVGNVSSAATIEIEQESANVYVATTGSDATGDGTQSNPWRTIGFAMTNAGPFAMADRPLSVNLFPGEYAELVTFLPFVTLQPVDPDGGGVQIRPPSVGGTPVIRGAGTSVLRGIEIRLSSTDPARVLLEIDDVAMTVENVVFDGQLRPNSTGIDISGPNSSDSLIRQCQFINLGTGLLSTNSAVAVSDNTFNNISANSSSSRAIAIGFTVSPGKGGAQTPALGDRGRILETGFNRFRGLPQGAKAIEFINVPVGVTSAQFNDWGVYTEAEILQRVSVPFKQSGEAVSVVPFIPQAKALGPGTIAGVILDSTDNLPLPLSVSPEARIIGGTLFPAPADGDGIFLFDSVPAGFYSLFARATSLEDTSPQSVSVRQGQVAPAIRFLIGGDAPSGVPGDVNGTGVVNAVDVQLVINAALGIAIDPFFNADINGDNRVNAVDIQLVINAVLGIDISGQIP